MAAKYPLHFESSSSKDDHQDEDFHDAEDFDVLPEYVSLSAGIDEAQVALDAFLNNHFEDAKARMEPLSGISLYHSLGYAFIMFLQASITMEAAHIEKAVDVVRASVETCQKQRRRVSFADSFLRTKNARKKFYYEYSDDQAHAELCYAECLLMRAFLMFVQDENLVAMIKGGLKIRECYKSYKECWKILKHREWNDPKIRDSFETGVRMGVGAFNLLISLLPTKILKLLEFVGFSGNKNFGLTQLHKAAAQQDTLRFPLSALMLLFYYIFATVFLGSGEEENVEEGKRQIAPCIKKYPNSAMFLFFHGRIALISGDSETAMSRYQAAIDSQSEWINFHHMCYWELLWTHCFLGDWVMAMKYAEILSKESRWSKATYLYQKSCFLIQFGDANPETIKEDLTNHINRLMETIPRMIQRFAGKSLPIEKFALKKSRRYFEQKGRLTLPALELIYVWNGFRIVAHHPDKLERMMQTIEKEINLIVQNKDNYIYYYDDYCLAMTLKGVCLKHKGLSFQATQCFEEVLTFPKNLKQDLYLLPWCQMELAHICVTEENLVAARKHLEKARSYKGYSLESRLHFRMHSMSLYLRARERGDINLLENPSEFSDTIDDLDELEVAVQAKEERERPEPVILDPSESPLLLLKASQESGVVDEGPPIDLDGAVESADSFVMHL